MMLIQALEEAGEDISAVLSLVDLYPFAVQYRYESVGEKDRALDRPALLAEIEELFKRVDERLSTGTEPHGSA